MERTYEIFLGSSPVGRAEVHREGLYYRILCRCRLHGDSVCRIRAACGENRADLGILVPEGTGFVSTARIPVKQLGEGELIFSVLPQRERTAGKFVPICPEEPFGYIARLKDAFLARQGDRVGAVFPEKNETE